MILNGGHVNLGIGSIVDEGGVLGYSPSRAVADLKLVVGPNAKIRTGSVIYLGSRIGENFETGHNVIVREENSILNNVKIWSNTVVDYKCSIGNNVKIHSGCYIAQQSVIEDDVFIAPGVIFSNEKYPTGIYSESRIAGPIIRKSAKVGVNATVLPGVLIGAGAVVGAGSVVTRDVPEKSVVYGVPARIHGHTRDIGL